MPQTSITGPCLTGDIEALTLCAERSGDIGVAKRVDGGTVTPRLATVGACNQCLRKASQDTPQCRRPDEPTNGEFGGRQLMQEKQAEAKKKRSSLLR